MTIPQHCDQFVAQNIGKYIDEDHSYGSQCWDVVAKYARVEYGCPSFPTVSGGAEGLWRFFGQPIPQYFYKVGPSEIQKGDVIVWDSSFYRPYGHTALCWERTGSNSMLVLEQDGSKDPNGDGIADGVSYIADRTLYKVNGGLRPIGDYVSDKVKIIGAPIFYTDEGGDRRDIFVMGSDNGLYQKYFGKNGWSEWVQIGKAIVGLLELQVTDHGNSYDVYCLGGAGDIMHFWFRGDGWSLETLGIPAQ